MGLPRLIRQMRRRWFGTYTLDDPRPIAAEAPYTYYLPSENQLLVIAPGDFVQLIFRSVPPGERWDAERMWVRVTAVSSGACTGILENVPFDMPQLRVGHPVEFNRHNIIDIQWAGERRLPPPPSPPSRQYWDRCIVDDCILERRSSVDYLYREQPEPIEEGETYPDSGWRIRGTAEAVADDNAADRKPHYVALGTVLNRDDTWLSLIDSPIGSAFQREANTGRFVRLADEGI